MAYEKNTWSDGDVITAEKLNNIEKGIEDAGSGGVLPQRIVEVTKDDVLACADENNEAFIIDVVAYAIRRHLGVVSDDDILPEYKGRYLICFKDDVPCVGYNQDEDGSLEVPKVAFWDIQLSFGVGMAVEHIYFGDGHFDTIEYIMDVDDRAIEFPINGTTYKVLQFTCVKFFFAIEKTDN